MKTTLSVLVLLVALVAGGVAAAFWLHRDLPASILEARYAGPQSKFIVLDGVRIHYRDEGMGPVVVLIHEEFDSLRMWEPWVAALKDRYRVIRFDLTSHGLTGPDPTGDYSVERTVRLVERFVDGLQLDQFSLGGSALGGTVAGYYAARHPARVDRLIIVNPGAFEDTVAEHAALLDMPSVFNVIAYAAPNLFAKSMLRNKFADPSRVTHALIEERWMLWRREGNRRGELARIQQFVPTDTAAQLRALRAPVLLMWGEKNRRLQNYQSIEDVKRLLSNARSVRIDVIRGAGRMPVQEDPRGTARSVRDFLDAGHGKLPSDPPPNPNDPWRTPGQRIMEGQYLTRAA